MKIFHESDVEKGADTDRDKIMSHAASVTGTETCNARKGRSRCTDRSMENLLRINEAPQVKQPSFKGSMGNANMHRRQNHWEIQKAGWSFWIEPGVCIAYNKTRQDTEFCRDKGMSRTASIF